MTDSPAPVLRQHAEQQFAEELAQLAAVDDRPRPPGCPPGQTTYRRMKRPVRRRSPIPIAIRVSRPMRRRVILPRVQSRLREREATVCHERGWRVNREAGQAGGRFRSP